MKAITHRAVEPLPPRQKARWWVRAAVVPPLFFVLAGGVFWLGSRLATTRHELADVEATYQQLLVEKAGAEREVTDLRLQTEKLQAEKAVLEDGVRKLTTDRDTLHTELSLPAVADDVRKLRATLAGQSPRARAWALYIRGEEAAKLGQADLSSLLFAAAVEEDGNFAPALNRLGLAAADAHIFKEADGYFRRASAADPAFVPSSFNLVLLYLTNHHTSKSDLAVLRPHVQRLRSAGTRAPRGTLGLLAKFEAAERAAD